MNAVWALVHLAHDSIFYRPLFGKMSCLETASKCLTHSCSNTIVNSVAQVRSAGRCAAVQVWLWHRNMAQGSFAADSSDVHRQSGSLTLYICLVSKVQVAGYTDEWMAGWTDGWMQGWMEGRRDGRKEGRKDVGVGEWIGGGVERCVRGWVVRRW